MCLDCLKDRAPRGGNREGFITILENLMTGIHFLYFPVEEFSENGATIVQRNSGGKKNVKKLGGGWHHPLSPTELAAPRGGRCDLQLGGGREVENFEGGSSWSWVWIFKVIDLATCGSRSRFAVCGRLWGSWES